MPVHTSELLALERPNDIRALAPHITYAGLMRWFNTLPKSEYDTPTSRRAISPSRTFYGVQQRAARIMRNSVSILLSPYDQPGMSVAFRGRTEWRRDGRTREVITENGRAREFHIELLGREHLAWRRGRSAGALDLIAPGTMVGGTYNPAIISVYSQDKLVTVTEAETLLLDAAPRDPAIVGPTYTTVPLF